MYIHLFSHSMHGQIVFEAKLFPQLFWSPQFYTGCSASMLMAISAMSNSFKSVQMPMSLQASDFHLTHSGFCSFSLHASSAENLMLFAVPVLPIVAHRRHMAILAFARLHRNA